MKIKFLIASLCFIFLASCDSNNSSSSSNGGSNYTPSYEPEYFTEDAPEQSICGNCNGRYSTRKRPTNLGPRLTQRAEKHSQPF